MPPKRRAALPKRKAVRKELLKPVNVGPQFMWKAPVTAPAPPPTRTQAGGYILDSETALGDTLLRSFALLQGALPDHVLTSDIRGQGTWKPSLSSHYNLDSLQVANLSITNSPVTVFTIPFTPGVYILTVSLTVELKASTQCAANIHAANSNIAVNAAQTAGTQNSLAAGTQISSMTLTATIACNVADNVIVEIKGDNASTGSVLGVDGLHSLYVSTNVSGYTYFRIV